MGESGERIHVASKWEPITLTRKKDSIEGADTKGIPWPLGALITTCIQDSATPISYVVFNSEAASTTGNAAYGVTTMLSFTDSKAIEAMPKSEM